MSHDGEAHVARFAAYYKAFLDGQFPLRWAGDLNYGYGSPVFIFYYPLPGLLSIPIHALGLSFEATFKLIIGMFFGLSFITFFLWAKEFVRREAAFLGALLYGLAPYHFLNLYVRGDIGELVALGIVPLVFLFIKKSIEVKSSGFIILAGISYALLILSHNAVSLMFSPVILLYAFILSRNLKDVIFGLTPIVLGLILSAFFWAPSLIESRYTNRELFIGDMFKDHFPSIQQLTYSPWGFGPDVNKPGGLSPQIGILNLSLAIGSIALLFKKFKEKKMVLFWTAVLVFSIFLTLNFSSLIWEKAPLFRFLQFPWRMTSLSGFASIILAMYFLNEIIDKKIIVILITAIFVYSLSFLKTQPINAKDDSFYLSYKGTTDYHGAASSIWTAGDFSIAAKAPYEVIEGEGEIREIKRKSNVHEFNVIAPNDLKIVDNTVYFPGWQVMVDGDRVPIQFQDPNYRGLITFSVPRSAHNIKVSFGESPTRIASDFLNLTGLLIIITTFAFRSRTDKILRKI
ncbi:MAG: hypothetical protein A3C30_00660 [Candidatus Levybacteria bacterium RIFCSPHIGHO2_02_FULL_40_18]|nr:MAG: hypothetical protein A2869_03270 [Candidatus Levybacteria bacterium RIFCSPHIGHO2_01_FULL_40_58]OGH27212.1 MAG: hypothetical protein A3C30_00660 [Candidatus Levybacteria bacterium RIFCSPHIGHO2_02_FULL_40_18]OGH31071.1 MAG: hypothetical protein A3E43_05075 [Candidatus Levybacteria bacterium RIFCSPHIGHO2_12_FULL_40_31]OGH40761.1 MAG: hypothetical protein A2894_03365 [Candidatus Levybacteria bacterium RIFCSPLOWO2_01_FULL_40_64]OGH49399.1 MAG: hypothetical protein A3I54_02005 [Candidatus Lev